MSARSTHYQELGSEAKARYEKCSMLCGLDPYMIPRESYDLDRDMTMIVYHSVDDSPHNPRWIETGRTTLVDLRPTEMKHPGLDIEALKSIANLVNISRHLPYRLKVIIKQQEKELDFYTFLRANDMLVTDMRYSLTIVLDHDYSPIAVNAKPVDYVLANRPFTKDIYTDIYFKTMESAPQVDTASFIHKMEKEREAKERGANQDNRSFLAKYWIYILPVLIFAILSGSVNTEGAANGR